MFRYKVVRKLFASALACALITGCATASPETTSGAQSVAGTELDVALSQIATRKATGSDLVKREDGIFEFYLEGIPAKELGGKPTQIFSLLGIPENPSGKPLPAIVLVHGGGGTAFASWVHKWNEAGFAALAIATEGQTDENLNNTGKGRRQWARHEFSGPKRAGIYTDHAKPSTEQWMFHAVSAAIAANSYLRAMPEVDPDHVGIAGISWGGIITSTTIGFDQRFDFAIPIYGTGSLNIMPNQYGRALSRQTGYGGNWEPMLRIAKFKSPILWVNGREDTHFTLDAQANTALAASAHNSFSLIEGLKHAQKFAELRNEPYNFAQTIVSGGAPVDAQVLGSTLSGEDIIAAFSDLPDDMANAELEVKLHTTKTTPDVFDKVWKTDFLRQMRSKDGALNIPVPTKAITDAEGWFVSVSAKTGEPPLTFSTRFCRVSETENAACK